MLTEQFEFKWENQHSDLINTFDHLRSKEWMTDVTLCCEGEIIKAHKIILAASSPVLHKLLDNQNQHAIIVFQERKYSELKAIIDFIYKGQVSVSLKNLENFSKAINLLKIKGLIDLDAKISKMIAHRVNKSNYSNISDKSISNFSNTGWKSQSSENISADQEFHSLLAYTQSKNQQDIVQKQTKNDINLSVDIRSNFTSEKIEGTKRKESDSNIEESSFKRRVSKSSDNNTERLSILNTSIDQSVLTTKVLTNKEFMEMGANSIEEKNENEKKQNKMFMLSPLLKTMVSSIKSQNICDSTNERSETIRVEKESNENEATNDCSQSENSTPSIINDYFPDINIKNNKNGNVSREISTESFSSERCSNLHQSIDARTPSSECHMSEGTPSTSLNLQIHKEDHSSNKFQCEICKKELASKANLKAHSRIHTGEKPYKCHVCEVKFCQKSTLTKHIKNRH